MRILVTINSYQDLDGPWHNTFKNKGWQIDLARGPLSEAELLGMQSAYNGIICGEDTINQTVIDHLLPSLKVISKSGVGLDTIDTDHAKSKNISIHTTYGVNTRSVVEHFIGLTIALLRNFKQYFNETTNAIWTRRFSPQLTGKTLGIIGLGAVGGLLAQTMHTLGCKILSYDPHAKAIPNFVTQTQDLEQLLEQSDIIGLTCALTPETRQLINSTTLGMMKANAFLVNTSRGDLVHSKDVAIALNKGTLSGYATDVLDAEPPTNDHPLLSAPNCIITPHIASKTFETSTQQVTNAVENLIESLCVPAQTS